MVDDAVGCPRYIGRTFIMPGQAVLVKSDGQPGTIFVSGTAIAALDNIAD